MSKWQSLPLQEDDRKHLLSPKMNCSDYKSNSPYVLKSWQNLIILQAN